MDMVAVPKVPERRRRLLVVDDDDGLRENLADLLSSAGYEVATAADTTEALRAIASGEFDLVLTDLRIPGPNGLDLIRTVRRDFPDMRAILMTAFGNTYTEIESVRRGAIGYLKKPFEAEEVTGLVEKILSLQGE